MHMIRMEISICHHYTPAGEHSIKPGEFHRLVLEETLVKKPPSTEISRFDSTRNLCYRQDVSHRNV